MGRSIRLGVQAYKSPLTEKLLLRRGSVSALRVCWFNTAPDPSVPRSIGVSQDDILPDVVILRPASGGTKNLWGRVKKLNLKKRIKGLRLKSLSKVKMPSFQKMASLKIVTVPETALLISGTVTESHPGWMNE